MKNLIGSSNVKLVIHSRYHRLFYPRLEHLTNISILIKCAMYGMLDYHI